MKKLFIVFISLVIVVLTALVVFYNVVTSEYGIKTFVLPFVAEKTNSNISLDNVAFSAFSSSLDVKNFEYSSDKLKVKSGLLEVRTNIYDLIFSHKLNIKSLLLKDSDIFIDITPVKNSENRKLQQTFSDNSNTADDSPTSSSKPAKSEKMKFSLNNINLENLKLTVKNDQTITKITELKLNIPAFSPNAESIINLDSKLSVNDGKTVLDGYINSKTNIKLNEDFMPLSIDSLSAVELGGNKMPVSIKFNTGSNGAFSFDTNIENIFIGPFAEAFVPGAYSNTKGKIDRVSIVMNGNNIYDLKTLSEPVKTEVNIDGAEIYNKGMFKINEKKISVITDLSALKKGEFIPEKLTVNNLNTEYIQNDQLIVVKDLNIGLSKKNSESARVILNTGFDYTKGIKKISGAVAGNISFSGNISGKPELASANLTLTLNGNEMPIKINYNNKKDGENLDLNVKDIVFKPFIDFSMPAGTKLFGNMQDLSLSVNGNCENAFSKLKDKNVILAAKINMQGLNVSEPEKYSAGMQTLSTAFNINNILNEKYYIDKLNIKNPKVILLKKQKESSVAENNVSGQINTPASNVNKPSSESADNSKKGKAEKKKIDFEIKDLTVIGGSAEIIADKKVSCTNITVNSKDIRSGKLSNLKLIMDYNYAGKMSGTLETDNKFLISEELIPEVFNSAIELSNGKNVSHSSINFTSRQTSNENLAFTADVNVNNLLLDPIISAFVQPPYNSSRTNIDTVNVNLSGNNLKDPIKADGNITGKLSGISIPVDVKQQNLIEAIFFPIRVIADFASNTRLKFVTGDVANAMMRIDNAFNKEKRLNFESADINIKLKSGLIAINHFNFAGDSNNPVSQMKLGGTVNMNNKALNLKTDTTFAGLNIPLEVNGTIEKPQADTAKMTAQLLQKNSDTIIKTGLDMTETINSTVKNIKDKNFDKLLQNIPADNVQNQNSGNAIGQILNAVTGQNNSSSSPVQPSSQTKQSSRQSSNTVNQIFGIINNVTQQKNSNQGKTGNKSESIDNQVKNLLNF